MNCDNFDFYDFIVDLFKFFMDSEYFLSAAKLMSIMHSQKTCLVYLLFMHHFVCNVFTTY